MSKYFKNRLSKALYGMETDDAISKNLCVRCKQPAYKNIYSEAGKREFKISGLCERCFDEVTYIEEDDFDHDEPAF